MSPLSISVRFSSETIDFASVQVSIILNGHSLNLSIFDIFLKIPFLGFTRRSLSRNSLKFRLSRNLTKFDKVARFRKTIPTVMSISSSESYNFSRIFQSDKITVLPFFIKMSFFRTNTILTYFIP